MFEQNIRVVFRLSDMRMGDLKEGSVRRVSGRLGGLRRVLSRWQLYVLLFPAVVTTLLFHYYPIYGIQIAFKNYKNSRGIWGSKWVGLKHFKSLFSYVNFGDILRNTLSISLYSIAVFPCAVIFALMLNEVRNLRFKKTIQMVSYAPHFMSTVVVVSMLQIFMQRSNGLFNNILARLGFERVDFLAIPKYFATIYVWSGVWQNLGWNAIIYIAALAGVSLDLIEAAKIDGANRMQIILHVNLPHILPTIITLLIMSTGSVLSVGFEKIYLMQNPLNLDASRVISTYVYEMGIENARLDFATAVGLFNNVVNIIILVIVNTIARKTAKISIF